MINITIIGGGIVGCAIAYELSHNKNFHITLIERSDIIPGINQSSRNGGIIHSSVYYPNDIEPLKAKLCLEGNERMYAFCKQYDLPHKNTGKLIVATDEREEEYIHFFYKTGIKNGVKGVKIITGAEAKVFEPNLENIRLALHVPSAGSAALIPLLSKIKELGESNGVSFILGTTVTGITRNGDSITIATNKKAVQTDMVINAAGLYSDVIASELCQFDKSQREDIHMNGMHIYQTPYCYDTKTRERVYPSAKDLPVLLHKGVIAKAAGVHLSPAFDFIDGKYIMKNTISIGPVKTLGLGKEDYTTNLKPAKTYIADIPFFPHLKEQDLTPRYAGIMAINKGHDDFIIERDKKFPDCIQLVGMDSPAWTSSLAIAKYVSRLIA